MVVIEPCSDPDTTRNRTNTEIPEHSNAQTEESSREDDGFETASDGESDGQDRNPDSSKPEEQTPEEPTAEQLQQVSWIWFLPFWGGISELWGVSEIRNL